MASVKRVVVKVRDTNKDEGYREEVRYRVTWRDQDHKAGKATFKRKVDADALCSEVEHAVRSGTYVDRSGGRQTFGAYVATWRPNQVHYKGGTGDLVDSRLRNHILPFFGGRPIGSITTTAVKSWIQDRSKVIKPRTMEGVYRLLVTIFRAAVEDGLIAKHPCPLKPNLPAVVKVPIVPLQIESVITLADEVPERSRGVIVDGFGLGLRQGEAFGLRPDHFDFLRRTVRIDQQVVMGDDGVTRIGPLKTPASYRTIPLPAIVAEAVARHMQQFEPGEFGLLFTNDDGKAHKRNRWNESVLAPAVKRANIRPDTTFHDLRHFYASALIFKGQSVKVVQGRLGHKSATETLDTYGHLWVDDEDGTRKAIDGLFPTGLSTTESGHVGGQDEEGGREGVASG